MARFDGKVIIVTGSASGIGKEIAIRFAQEGGAVVIADLNLEAAQATADEIKATGAEAMALAMDVTNEEQVDNGVAAVVEQYGKVDVLVSNAGIQDRKSVVRERVTKSVGACSQEKVRDKLATQMKN